MLKDKKEKVQIVFKDDKMTLTTTRDKDKDNEEHKLSFERRFVQVGP